MFTEDPIAPQNIVSRTNSPLLKAPRRISDIPEISEHEDEITPGPLPNENKDIKSPKLGKSQRKSNKFKKQKSLEKSIN